MNALEYSGYFHYCKKPGEHLYIGIAIYLSVIENPLAFSNLLCMLLFTPSKLQLMWQFPRNLCLTLLHWLCKMGLFSVVSAQSSHPPAPQYKSHGPLLFAFDPKK